MARYSPFVDSLLSSDALLLQINPTAPLDPARVSEIREANEDKLSGGGVIRDIRLITLVRALLYYAYDALPQSHRITQEGTGTIAHYMHGMVHRREGDYDNARYWFGKAGSLPFFASLPAPGDAATTGHGAWDPLLFTGLCEQAKAGAAQPANDLAKLQRAEFDAVFDYVWRLAIDTSPA